MKKTSIICCGLALFAFSVSAQAPEASHWTAAQFKEMAKTLAPKMNAHKSASQALGNLGTHTIQLSYREASGEAEIHEGVTDIFVVEAGEATLTVGGKVASGKTTAPGEIRGTAVEGGKVMELGAGDVVNIPPGTPHQLTLKAGKSLAYLVVKVQSK